MRGALIDRYIQTPLEIERKLGLLRANVMHLEMSLDQMFFFRPLPELSTYRTHLPGLYLTGASTHPGGGVFGASGRNTAHVVQHDLRRKRSDACRSGGDNRQAERQLCGSLLILPSIAARAFSSRPTPDQPILNWLE